MEGQRDHRVTILTSPEKDNQSDYKSPSHHTHDHSHDHNSSITLSFTELSNDNIKENEYNLDNDYESEVSSINDEDDIDKQEIKDIMNKINDEIDISLYEEKFNDNSLIVDGFKCPDEFVPLLTAMEFEEIVFLFKMYDANVNKSIDKHEARKVLYTLGLDSSIESAEIFLSLVDADGGGEIEFSEFCRFVVLLKQGDQKVKQYQALLEKLRETPLGELDHQAKIRNLKLKFNLVNDKEASIYTEGIIVMELLISGEWTELVNGEIITHYAIKRYEGTGKTTKQAKYSAATNALVKLSDIMPGIKFKEGEFPKEWIDWVDENLAKGIEPSIISKVLSSKGFHPYKNLGLMQRIIVWKAFDKFLLIYPDLDIINTPNLDNNFKQWINEMLNRGIDGEILLNVLKDHSYDLIRFHPYIGQKILNNELGKLTDMNGNECEILDFFLACEKGYIDEVKLYCECLQSVNEERIHRSSSEPMYPLALATMGGHIEVMKILINYKADINAVDRRGRNCLHLAAFKGYTEACEILIAQGAIIFQGDHQGNTPLHLAVLGNHLNTVNYLAMKSQDLTRAITSDQIRCKAGMTFDDLVTQVYEQLPHEKLLPSDTLRFEKKWLSDAANKLITLMDKDVQWMLPQSREIIQDDVLARFDPRPEVGMYISTVASSTTAQMFVPTIPGPNELGILLKYIYRLASIDSLNNFQRTPLHLACDINHINSHKDIIYLLIDKYGCNTFMQDKHKRRPIDLLILDKHVVNSPSATQANEEIIYERRQIKLTEFSEALNKQEQEKTKKRREFLMDECIFRAETLSTNLWEIVRVGSILLNRYNRYEVYEDPDTKNIFYTLSPDKNNLLSTYSEYSWKVPKDMRVIRDRKQGFNYQRLYQSTLLRRIENWEMLRCNITNLEYYYNYTTDTIRYITPKEINWDVLLKTSTVVRVLGYSNEWEELIYDNKHIYYHNIINALCQWDMPEDAIEVLPNQRFCTTHQFPNIAVEQKWYSCEQCNRQWSTSLQGLKQLLRLCEPCVFRCHKGHKGIRLVRTSSVICNCTTVCEVNNCACIGHSVSAEQIQTIDKALKQQNELQRQKDLYLIIPPVFAMVPPLDQKGRKKSRCGWMMCHRAPLLNLDSLYNRKGTTFDYDSETGSYVDSNLSFNLSNISSDSDSDFPNPSKLSRQGSIKKQKSISLTRQSSSSRSKRQMLIKQKSMKYLNNDDLPYKRPFELPNGWIEVYDPEERQHLPIGSKVLVTIINEIIKVYGIIKKAVKYGFYSVLLIDRKAEEIFPRSQLYLLSRKTFYFNMLTGQSAWSIDDARHNPYDSIPLSLIGDEWVNCQNRSTIRRVFDNYIEFHNIFIDIIYYVNVNVYDEEQAALKLQRLYRQKHKKVIPIEPWISHAFTVDPPDEVVEYCRQLAGWAYLRRRSRNLGDFRDVHGVEWEEYADMTSSEYFYWSEDGNSYVWEKPEVPDRTKKVVELFPIGSEVLYRFPNMTRDEPAIVVKQRVDDQTGEDMYDVQHKVKTDYILKWVPHIELKRPPLEGDDLLLKRFEQVWRRQIKRNHEGLYRKRKRERDRQLQIETERLKEIKVLTGVVMESNKGDTASIMRGRVLRIQSEKQEIIEEKERNEGRQRRQLVKERVEKIKEESKVLLSRADILSLTRAVDTQFQIKDRIEARHKQQIKLMEENQIKQLQRYHLEESLRVMESNMTTPRSLARRQIVRSCHIAMQRQSDKYIICDWGCGEWIKMGYDQLDHTLNRCMRRIIPCSLGCDKKLMEEEWLSNYTKVSTEDSDGDNDNDSDSDEETVQRRRKKLQRSTVIGLDKSKPANLIKAKAAPTANESVDPKVQTMSYQHYHETEECPKRLVYCPRQCLEWIPYEEIDKHLDMQCPKRPAKPIYCRLGCNEKFGGSVEKLIESEEERLYHETEECIYRIVRCNWRYDDGKYCAAQMQARERDEHRDYHLSQLGVYTYKVPGTYIYKIPSKTTRIKVQAWGAGGGSGHFKHRRGGSGGGGAFVEVILTVEPYEVLEICVGSGGGAGVVGTEIEILDLEYQREQNKNRLKQEMYLTKEQRIQLKNEKDKSNTDVIDSTCGVTSGGTPGGGDGYGGGGLWAAGGGGGYTLIAKRTPQGNHTLIVASGGGGGCSLDGLPGVGMDGILPGTRIDTINGGSATCHYPGIAGDSGSVLNSKWSALPGSQWQGGHGSEFGAGGGGGYFGGGGGGTTPGLGGGGGGGASYIYLPRANDYVIVMGQGFMPGGLQHDPPDAVGIGDWDKVGGFVGQGGLGDAEVTHAGNNGCVRIFRPGHY